MLDGLFGEVTNITKTDNETEINTERSALNDIEIKHNVSEIKADIKLCRISFSVVTSSVSFPLYQDHLLGACAPC
jgi:hypothetical protein